MSILTYIGAIVVTITAVYILFRLVISLVYTVLNARTTILNVMDDPDHEWWRWLFLPLWFIHEWCVQFWIAGTQTSKTIRVKTDEERALLKAAHEEQKAKP